MSRSSRSWITRSTLSLVAGALVASSGTRAGAQSFHAKPVAPHTTRVTAMWAVLTRLRRPAVDRYKGAVRALIDDLTPLEKLHLYDSRRAPDRLSPP